MAQSQSTCPICDAQVALQGNLEVSEIINCVECQSRLVVAQLQGAAVILEEAPQVEEDWGE